MIGRSPLPPEYLEWNRTWGCPYGRGRAAMVSLRERLRAPDAEAYGPFAFQPERGLKTFQYPWAYFTADPQPGMRALISGAGLGGLQFVLAMEGVDVVNVDPTVAGGSTVEAHARLNDAYGTDVRLIGDLSEAAELPAGSFDRVFLLSTLDNLGRDAGRAVLSNAADLLAPGGLCLLTSDLLLHLRPFGVLAGGDAERNVDLYELTKEVGLEMSYGDPRELNGFPEFDPVHVVQALPEIYVGPYYSSASQNLVLHRPG
ncbi:class I SAM-dependent methyltransferase [Nonomuraea glycinis]|uniref:class I SAM-dependent methyltransferase n=1 Tax=Nonomuraea glycinis TaxID=2047744 RepID=UPI0033A3AB11